MNHTALMGPVFAMVLLTFIVWMKMYLLRRHLVNKHQLPFDQLSMQNRKLPIEFVTSGDNFRNLFELPVLFYTLMILLIVLNNTHGFYPIAAWCFVVTRYVHSAIHTTYNKILHRFLIYFTGGIIMWAMWGFFAWQMLFQASGG